MAAEDKKISDLTVVASTGGAEFTEVVKGSGNFRRKNNMTASAAPTVTDDSASDYAIGSLWHYNGSVWVCKDNTAGAAVWVRINKEYTEYVALLTQTGTDAPVATVLKNDTGLTWTPSYDDVGNFFVEPSVAPDDTKVAVFGTNGSSSGDVVMFWRSDKVNISTKALGVPTNAILSKTAVSVRIYP